jgi:hypothetical protein
MCEIDSKITLLSVNTLDSKMCEIHRKFTLALWPGNIRELIRSQCEYHT